MDGDMSDRDLGILEVVIVIAIPISILLAIIGVGSWELVKKLTKRLRDKN